MQNNTISTSIRLNIGDKSFEHVFDTDSKEQLYQMLWDYMTLEHLILYTTAVTLPDGTLATQIGFLNLEGREDQTEFDTQDAHELHELLYYFLQECSILAII